jgi:L-iditol 2-dehydrogenase
MIRIPEEVTFEEAAFVEPVNTCLKAIRKARIAAGEHVFVIGQGPIGLLLTFLARTAATTVWNPSGKFSSHASVHPRGSRRHRARRDIGIRFCDR